MIPRWIAVVSLATCSQASDAGTAMSYLRTYGPAADPVRRLDWGLIGVSLGVSVIVGLLLLWATFRHRAPMMQDALGRLPIERRRDGVAWIYVGVGISMAVLLACAVWTMMVLAAVATPPDTPVLTVGVTGHQWWWEVHYDDAQPSGRFATANEIHIPVGEPVRFRLDTVDVIHSFWIPSLTGKTDLIPGRTNYTWLRADAPGEYRGQCGEFCGAQHAHMGLRIIADDPPAFERWRQAQLTASSVPADARALHGKDVFLVHCAACHTIRGTGSGGGLGPDLTHLMARGTIAAGMLPNDAAHLSEWIRDPQAIKPGTPMPAIGLTTDDANAVVAFLTSLH